MTASLYAGPWSQAPNLSADATGSIHDDAQARSLGFKGALIGGSVLCSFMTPLLVDRFGTAWYERGFFKTSFITPVYETDEIRTVLEELAPAEMDEALVSVSLEKRSGERATAGYAGLAHSVEAAIVPWQRSGEPHAAPPPAPDVDPLPEEAIGSGPAARELIVTPEESATRRSAAGETSPWYTEASHWGGPIVPTFMYLLVNLGSGGRRLAAANARGARAGMNGTFQLLQTGPMLAGEPYTLSSALAEKGISGRTAFRTAEFTITDGEGRRVALARQKARWFIRNEG